MCACLIGPLHSRAWSPIMAHTDPMMAPLPRGYGQHVEQDDSHNHDGQTAPIQSSSSVSPQTLSLLDSLDEALGSLESEDVHDRAVAATQLNKLVQEYLSFKNMRVPDHIGQLTSDSSMTNPRRRSSAPSDRRVQSSVNKSYPVTGWQGRNLSVCVTRVQSFFLPTHGNRPR